VLIAVLQRDAEQIGKHCFDGFDLCFADIWDHKSSHHRFKATVVIRS
jgi:hypothetical protein